ncbi:MAG: alpha/beta fold hydrolase [Frankiaceae bacterium]
MTTPTLPVRLSGGPADPDRPVLLLLHGLGATADVWYGWRPVLEEGWPGRWLAPDLPGHAGAPPLPRYSFGALAAAVAGLLAPGDRVVVLGHSLGGVVGLTLASGWFGQAVEAVVGLGIKVVWSADELAKAQALAARPVAWFGSRGEAAARHLRVAGLGGLVEDDHPVVAAGLREEGGRWRPALDPAAFAVGEPDLPGLLAAARARVTLARGEHDPMVSDEQLAALHPQPVTLPGLGHNAHVEDPAAVARLLEPFAG